MGRVLICAVMLSIFAAPIAAQKRRTPPRKAPPAKKTAPAPAKTATPETTCPSLIGMGVKTIRSYCDVPAGRDPAQGVILKLPPHTGAATLSFDLHARHTYSEEQTKSGKGYSHYRAIIGVLAMNGDLLGRGAIDTEFRTVADLFDRIGGGAGPGGLKAVAPAGSEHIFVTIPAGIDRVSLLGESLDALTPAGHETVVMPGRPVAIVSNLLVEYNPAPASSKR
jgi:hypothetical protein